MSTTTDLQYPIGRLTHVMSANDPMRRTAIDEIAALPARMREAVAGLTEAQLDTPYRPGGWTVRQVVHHVPDSHVHAYIRLKLALTEDAPTIKPYDEKTWARLADSRLPVEVSLTLLDSVHARWVALCRDLKTSDWPARSTIRNIPRARARSIGSCRSMPGTRTITSLT